MFVYLHSPSGDTNVLALALGIIRDHKERVFYDYGNGNHPRSIWLSSLEMDENHRDALIGFHSFTGTDFISAFFRKGKKRCWSIMQSDDCFIQAFTVPGSNWNIDQNVECLLEEYVLFSLGRKEIICEWIKILHLPKKNMNERISSLILNWSHDVGHR